MQDVKQRIDEVQDWMAQYIADILDIKRSDVDVKRSFDQYGLDSAATVAFTSDLGRWLGVTLDTRIMIENEDISAVADHLRKSYGTGAVA